MRDMRFTFVCSLEERQMLDALASKHQRTKSDAIRLLIRKAYQEGAENNNSPIVQRIGDAKERHSGN